MAFVYNVSLGLLVLRKKYSVTMIAVNSQLFTFVYNSKSFGMMKKTKNVCNYPERRTTISRRHYHRYLPNKQVTTTISPLRPLSHYMMMNEPRIKQFRKHISMYVMCKEQKKENKIDYIHQYLLIYRRTNSNIESGC
jgi:hypothetical protein